MYTYERAILLLLIQHESKSKSVQCIARGPASLYINFKLPRRFISSK